MPQQFNVLKCFSCNVFQVHPVKKAIKWQCKLCGEKQSIKKHYGFGTAKECRLHVQKLNGIRADFDISLAEGDISEEDEVEPEKKIVSKTKTKFSKWTNYIEKTSETNDEEEIPNEIPEKKPKKVPTKYKAPYADQSYNNFSKPNLTCSNTTEMKNPEVIRDDKSISKLVLVNSSNILRKKIPTQTSTNEDSKPLLNSKWSQYVENRIIDESENDYGININENISCDIQNENSVKCLKSESQGERPKDIFSLTEEYDLDDILAI